MPCPDCICPDRGMVALNTAQNRVISGRKWFTRRIDGLGKAIPKGDRTNQPQESEAFRKAVELRGKADGAVTRIYAEAYGKNPGFFDFFRTLDFCRTFSNPNGWFVLSTDADFIKFLKMVGDRRER